MRTAPTVAISGDWHLGEHDKKAIECFFAYCARYQPGTIVLNGDITDNVELHKSQRGLRVPVVRGRGSLFTGEEVVLTHILLKCLRGLCPDSRIVYIEGNHEGRLPRLIASSLPEIYSSIPQLPELLGLKSLGIEWVPYSEELVIGDFHIFHGRKCNIHAAMTEGKDVGGSMVQGHTHRLKQYTSTTSSGQVYYWVEGGHLRLITASYTARKYPSWAQGWTVLTTSAHGLLPSLVPMVNGKGVAVVRPGEIISYEDINMAKVWAHVERALVTGKTKEVRRVLEGRLWDAA